MNRIVQTGVLPPLLAAIVLLAVSGGADSVWAEDVRIPIEPNHTAGADRFGPRGATNGVPIDVRTRSFPATFGQGTVFGFVVLFFLIVAVALILGAAQSQKAKDTYAQLARKYEGTVTGGGWFGMPKVRFVHRGVDVLVDIWRGGEHDPDFTRVHMIWPDRRFRCEVYPETFFSRVGSFLGMQDITVGTPDFDETYRITGSNPREVVEFLTPEVQRRINDLRRLPPHDNVYVSLNGGKFLIKKTGRINSYRNLEQFTQAVLELYDVALGRQPEGIAFVDKPAGAMPATDTVVCQICGENIESNKVLCRRCKTPHHHDCWEYYGACSTYGCRETKYTEPRRQRSAATQSKRRSTS